jgi:hypothetical protein
MSLLRDDDEERLARVDELLRQLRREVNECIGYARTALPSAPTAKRAVSQSADASERSVSGRRDRGTISRRVH